jgi:hypothetical protein
LSWRAGQQLEDAKSAVNYLGGLIRGNIHDGCFLKHISGSGPFFIRSQGDGLFLREHAFLVKSAYPVSVVRQPLANDFSS